MNEESMPLPGDRPAVDLTPDWIAMAQAEAEDLRQVNDANIARLARRGISVQVPGVDVLKFGALLDVLLGAEGSPMRVAYDLRVQQIIAAHLAEAETQVARAKLTAPGMVGPSPNGPGSGLILPR